MGWGHPFQGDFYPWRIGRVCAGDKIYPQQIEVYAPAILGLIPSAYAFMHQG
jgi:hypothetical protein